MPIEGTPRARQLVHRGVVEAAAFLIDEALVGPLEARRRVVAAWIPGATVHRLGSRLLLRLAAPRRVDCARAVGLPLVRATPATLASAPLAADEISALSPPPGAVILVEAGELHAVSPREADREDPASYLDLGAFEVVKVTPLGPAPLPARVVAEPAPEARALLGVSAPPPGLAALVAALQRAPASTTSAAQRASVAGAAGAGTSGLAAGAASWLASFLAALASLLTRFRTSGAGSGPSPRALPGSSSRLPAVAPQEPAGPSLMDCLEARLRDLAARLLLRARLAHLIGRRQAEYLDNLLDMFERGDLAEALRHAIPLGGDAALVAQSFGVPAPRADLAISLAQPGGLATAMVGGVDVYAQLRARYRAAFERLERDGKIEEAAFVLAELLRADEEAVAFLERHGKLKLAAELAEARHVAPAIQVRQWFLAGDKARALRLARRHGAFADAVARLEKNEADKRELAPKLRLLWAETLAEAGDFAAASDVAWPIVEARPLAKRWVDAAIAQGGPAAARLLPRKLFWAPESFPEVRERVLDLCADATGSPDERRAFAEGLLATVTSRAAETLARPVLRALVRDGAVSADPATQSLVSKLATFSKDDALRVDLPSWSAVERVLLAKIAKPITIEIAASDTGATRIHDAAYLPNGRVAVALGEGGVRVLGRDGRVLFHLDQPAWWIAVSDWGDRAIAMAPRGEVWRLARLDLVNRRVESWCEGRFWGAVSTFDGSTWVVATNEQVLVIDALAERFEALESFDLPFVEGISRTPTSCAMASQAGPNSWRFELPSWTLRSRKDMSATTLSPGERHDSMVCVTPRGSLGVLSRMALGSGPGDEEVLRLKVAREGAGDRIETLAKSRHARPLSAVGGDGWFACASRQDDGVIVHLLDEAEVKTRLTVTLPGTKRPRLRFAHDTLTIADDRGRLLVIDLAHGSVLRSFRL